MTSPGGWWKKVPRSPVVGAVHAEDCEDAIRELYTFLDGELTDTRRAAIRSHLDDCHPCLEAFDFEAELRMVVSHHCREAVPETLKQRIASLLAQDPAELPPR